MAIDRPSPTHVIDASVDQAIAEPLMVPLTVIGLDILADDTPEMAFAERNHLAYAF